MSIGADAFAASGLHRTYDPYAAEEPRVEMHQTQCRGCGFTPDDGLNPPKRCPKCRSQSWERFNLPGSILTHSKRYDRLS